MIRNTLGASNLYAPVLKQRLKHWHKCKCLPYPSRVSAIDRRYWTGTRSTGGPRWLFLLRHWRRYTRTAWKVSSSAIAHWYILSLVGECRRAPAKQTPSHSSGGGDVREALTPVKGQTGCHQKGGLYKHCLNRSQEHCFTWQAIVDYWIARRWTWPPLRIHSPFRTLPSITRTWHLSRRSRLYKRVTHLAPNCRALVSFHRQASKCAFLLHIQTTLLQAPHACITSPLTGTRSSASNPFTEASFSVVSGRHRHRKV